MFEFAAGFLGAVAGILFIGLYVVALSFIIWMMVDAAKHDKFWWLILVVAVPVIGAMIYFFVEKEHLYPKVGRKRAVKAVVKSE